VRKKKGLPFVAIPFLSIYQKNDAPDKRKTPAACGRHPLFRKRAWVWLCFFVFVLPGFSPSFGKEGGTRSVTGVFPHATMPTLSLNLSLFA